MSARMYQSGISGEGDGNTFYKDADKSSFRFFLLGLFGISLATRLGPEMVAIHAHSHRFPAEMNLSRMPLVPDLFLPNRRVLVFAALLIDTRIYHCITVHALRRVPGELSLVSPHPPSSTQDVVLDIPRRTELGMFQHIILIQLGIGVLNQHSSLHLDLAI
ncbi:uncharacterized protein B0T23DRAFT_325275 [Neurospora hispaniola]|uniref:Uncharacterized protein n=1 Tax=Neurospora hispaniola TaxID=588809 RepID=A0AAJ0MN08_9PEZI|nr:hypothetical protein B0T23DRAFT_325275 [Neurospora hispaniola]